MSNSPPQLEPLDLGCRARDLPLPCRPGEYGQRHEDERRGEYAQVEPRNKFRSLERGHRPGARPVVNALRVIAEVAGPGVALHEDASYDQTHPEEDEGEEAPAGSGGNRPPAHEQAEGRARRISTFSCRGVDKSRSTAAPTSRAAIDDRVSRDDESAILENQVRSLRDYCAARGLRIAREFVEIISGGRDDRPGLSQLLHEASLQRGRPFDLVVFGSLSRMTRGGTYAALEILRKLEAAAVGWRFVEQPLLDNDSTTPKLARDILLAVLAAVDEDYRARISRATKAAFQRRKNLGEAVGERVKWGRPPSKLLRPDT